MRARHITFLRSSSILGLAGLVVTGCGSSSQNPRGGAGAACYADKLCNAGLSCVGNVCVPSDGGGLPVDAPVSDANPADARDAPVASDGAAGGDGAIDGSATSDGAAGHDGGNAVDGGGDAAPAPTEAGTADTGVGDGAVDDAGAAG